jgi:hypothetical protein
MDYTLSAMKKKQMHKYKYIESHESTIEYTNKCDVL